MPHPDASTGETQRDLILRLLVEADGAKVPLPKVMAIAAQYNARILELRRMGYAIENEVRKVAGKRHSWFWLVPQPQRQLF